MKPLTSWIIYCLKDPETENIRYIGFTSQPLAVRVRKHIDDAQRRDFRCARWIKSLRSRGLLPLAETIETGSGDGWAVAEQRWISHMRTIGCDLVNTTNGGEGAPGRILSQETRQKISTSHIGKTISQQAKDKISLFGRGRKKSQEHGAKISKKLAGVPLTEERRRNISIALTGRKIPPDVVAKAAASRVGKKRSLLSTAKAIATRRANNNYIMSAETKGKISESQRRRKQLATA